MINYLTQLLGKPVFEPNGQRVARVLDVIARQEGRLPTVHALMFKSGNREGWVYMADVEINDSCVRLHKSWMELPEYLPLADDLRLQRDILDKQIVDVHNYRVVRVSDVRLAPFSNGYCVVGADTSARAILRRTIVSGPIELFAKLIRRPLQSNLIAWDDVETLEPGSAGGGRIRLKVPAEKIGRLHPADIADIVEQLNPQQRAQVIGALDLETAADTIEEMEDEDAAAIMETLEGERAADILEEMEPDEAADLLADLSDARSVELLEQMEPDEAADVKELLAYGEETAGGLMTTEYIAIPASTTAEETIQRLRELAPPAETIYYVYIVDDEERLVGVLPLRDLIVADPKIPISHVMSQNVRFAHINDHADKVAQIIGRYNLLALPVVDEDDRLSGIITVDDMMERLLPPERRRRLPHVTIDDNE